MNTLPKVDESVFLPLDKYEKIAKLAIYKYVMSKSLSQDPDFLSNIMYEAMKADWVYDPSKGTTRDTYRIKRCRWAISKYLYNIKHNKVSFDDKLPILSELNDDDSNRNICVSSVLLSKHSDMQKQDKITDRIQFILNNCDMSQDQRKCIEMYYFDGLTIPKIAKKIGKSNQRVQQNLQYAMKQMQVFCGVIDVNS